MFYLNQMRLVSEANLYEFRLTKEQHHLKRQENMPSDDSEEQESEPEVKVEEPEHSSSAGDPTVPAIVAETAEAAIAAAASETPQTVKEEDDGASSASEEEHRLQGMLVSDEEIFALEEHKHYAIIDSGATSTLCSAAAMEQLPPDRILEVDPEVRKRFRFGNGSEGTTSSRAVLKVQGVPLAVDVLETEKMVPMLISVKWLSENKAILDFGKGELLLNDHLIKLKRSASGHLLMPLEEKINAEQAHTAKRATTITSMATGSATTGR